MSEDERLAELSKLGKRSAKKDSSDDGKDDKKRCCARCRNHETELIELKGHKNYCPWRDCFCELCLKTVFRQKLMADQTASRRKRDEMKERAKKGLPLVVPTVKQVSLKNPCVPTPQQSPLASFITSRTSKEVSWEAITELMDAFSFNVNTSCLLYLVLKYISNNNVKDARSIILSAKEDIKKISNKTFSNGTGPVTQSTYMNHLEVVPVIVVPTEKVLDLSYQPSGMGYPRTPNQTYPPPYPRPIGPIGPIPPPAGATPQCAPWKQPYRQPWPHPPQIYEHNSFNEVPTNKESRTEIVEQMKPGDDETEEKLRRTDEQNIEEEKARDNREITPEEEIEIDVKSPEDEPKKEAMHRPSAERGTDKDSTYKDEFYIFGQRIGNELRRIPDRHSTTVAKFEIDRVIIRAMMGEYYVGTCQCCVQEEEKIEKLATPRISPSLPSSSFQPYKPQSEKPKWNPLDNDDVVKRKLSQDILSPVRNEYLTPNTSPLPIPFRPMVNSELSKWRLESDEEPYEFLRRKSSLDIISPTRHSSRSTSPLPSSFRPIVQRSQSPKWNLPHNDTLQLSFMKRKSLEIVSPVKDFSSSSSTSPQSAQTFRPFLQSDSKRPRRDDDSDQPTSFRKLKLTEEIRPPVIIKESLRPTTSTV